MTQSDNPKSAPSRKRSKKAQAPEPGSPVVESPAPSDPAQKQAVELHSGFQDLSRRAAELENRVGDLEQELQNARDSAIVADTRVAGLNHDLQKARDEAGAAATQTAQLKQELQKARDDAGTVGTRTAALERRLSDLDRESREARNKAATAEARAVGLIQDLQKARDEAGAASIRSADLTRELQKIRDATGAEESRAAGLERELKEARNKAAAAEARAVGLNEELQKSREDLGEADTGFVELESLVAGLEEELEKAGEDSARAETRAAELERRVGELDRDFQRVRDEACKAESRAAELTKKVGELDPELQQAWDDVDRAEAHFVTLEQRSQELKSQHASLVAGLEEEAAGLRRQIQDAVTAGEDSRRGLGEARQRIMEFTEEHHQLFGEQKNTLEALDSAQKANSELKAQAATLNERIRGDEAQISDANLRIEALQRELAEAKIWEAKAREWEATAAQLRETSGNRLADLVRFEKSRSEQEQRLSDLARTVTELERALQEAESSKSGPLPEGTEAGAAPPVDEPLVTSDEEAAVKAPCAPEIALSVPSPDVLPRSADETTLRPQNFFGPPGEDGQPRHVLMEILSRDSMGVLYRACERATHRQFAVRFMAGQAGEAQTIAIERTVEKLLALPHPNILHVQGCGRRKNRLYLEIDLVEAPTLGQAKIQEIPRVVAILRDVAAAVHYAHEEGILHGDLNPENILVEEGESGDHALVKDFGLAYLLESLVPPSSGKEAPLVIRNPAFLSPEQARVLKPALGVPADVYGLGVTLYAVLAGRAPFEGKDAPQVLKRVMIEEPLPLERVRPEVPETVAAIVRRAMAKERGLRFGSAKEVAEALGRFLES